MILENLGYWPRVIGYHQARVFTSKGSQEGCSSGSEGVCLGYKTWLEGWRLGWKERGGVNVQEVMFQV